MVRLFKRRIYEMRAKCYNCGYKFLIKIPRGISVKEFASEAVCDRCGCNEDIAIDVPDKEEVKEA